jgi:hypothetical protein
MGWLGNTTLLLHDPRDINRVHNFHTFVWVPGLVWKVAQNFVLTRIRSSGSPTHSVSLYRLSYPSPNIHPNQILIVCVLHLAINLHFQRQFILYNSLEKSSRFEIHISVFVVLKFLKEIDINFFRRTNYRIRKCREQINEYFYTVKLFMDYISPT